MTPRATHAAPQGPTRDGSAAAIHAQPQPNGMPEFDLFHAALAALAHWLRAAWGHRAASVSAVDVLLGR